MKLKVSFLLALSCLVISCNSTEGNNEKIEALEIKIDNLSKGLSQNSDNVETTETSINNFDTKKMNARLSSLESSLKKLEKTFANFSKNQNSSKKKEAPKPSGPWKRDSAYKTSVGNSYYQGPKDAKVVITEWSDYY